MLRAPILVTGSHRSGTTWVGKMIDHTPYTCYLGEVLRPDADYLAPGLITYWYEYLKPEPGSDLHKGMLRLLTYQFNWPDKKPYTPSKLWLYRLTHAISRLPRPIIKDPMAALSAENLAKSFDMKVVCLIRHPAAVVASLKRATWHFDFRNFLDQPELMQDWLAPLLKDLDGHPHSIIEEGALLWRCIYHVLHAYIQRNEDWIVWRHEDISADPGQAFACIYHKLDLPYTDSARQKISEYSARSNPIFSGNGHLIKRNTHALIDSWRQELTSEETLRVREIVEPLSRYYYCDDEW